MQPVVRITAPEHAGRANGPDVTVRWDADGVKVQQISVDGSEYIDVPANERSFLVSGLAEGVHRITVLVNQKNEGSVVFYAHVPVQLSAAKLYRLDLAYLRRIDVSDRVKAAEAFDTLHCAAVLQGLANREKPRLYINYTDVDQFWLDNMRTGGAYLEHAEIVELGSIEEVIKVFASDVSGAVVWDQQIPATNNVASTICGAENLVPVRYDPSKNSLHSRLIKNGPELKPVYDLVGKFNGKGKIPDIGRESTGSAKCDAYLWAKTKFIDSGKCNPAELGYWCDAYWLQQPRDMSLECVGLTNHDFVVARKGFVFDLGPWDDETPRDDPKQTLGADRKAFCEIMQSCYDANKGRIIHMSGFTPWAMKYTNHGNAGGKHEGVPTEWEHVRITSNYNCYLDADAIGSVALANASVFQHYPLPDRLVQNRPPTRRELEAKGYIGKDGKVAPRNFVYHYLGDYDSAAWLYQAMPRIWNDPARSKVPNGWAFNPNLIERVPMIFDWVYDTKSPTDYFVAGDSGAGYVNPTALLPPRGVSGLPSGAKMWIEHNIPYFRRLNYSIVGFLINAFCGELTDESNRMYKLFSGDGVMTQVWMPKNKKQDHLLDNMPVAHMKQDIGMTPEISIKEITKHGRPGEAAFLGFRSILQSPEWIKAVNDGIREARQDCNFEPVDPCTYFYLLRHSLGGSNNKRATYTFDTVPATVRAGQTIVVTAGLRNDGWDTWQCNGDDAVVLTARFGDRKSAKTVALPQNVEPGAGAVVEFTIVAPKQAGSYQFTLELRKGNKGWFGDAGDLPWAKVLRVLQQRTSA